MKGNNMKTLDLVYIALGAVLIAVCTWLSIPAAVPFTMQTFAVFCVLRILGGKRGLAAILVYLLLGAAGLPVFSGFRAGFGAILGTTGGYMVGFIFIGLIYWLAEALLDKKLWIEITAMALGLLVMYAFGTAWFMAVYARTSGAVGVGTALTWCVLPFIVPDLVKMALAVVLSHRVRKAIGL